MTERRGAGDGRRGAAARWDAALRIAGAGHWIPALLVTVLLAAAGACIVEDGESQGAADASPADYPSIEQGTLWLGRPLMSREPTAEQATALAEADRAVFRDRNDVEALVRSARIREDVWRFNEAVDLYARAMARAPDDFEPPLQRGHRLIRLRSLREALAELDRARELDPTGFNTSYLRAKTLYLQGRFAEAAEQYQECLDRGGEEVPEPLEGDPRQCAHTASDPASRIAMTAWAVRAYRRAGQDDQARRLIEELPREVDPDALDGPFPQYEGSPIVPGDNSHYWAMLRFFRGDLPVDSLMDQERWGPQWATVAYGVAAWRLADGREDEARPLLEEIVDDPNWARLGHVAAEADLVRLQEGSSASLR